MNIQLSYLKGLISDMPQETQDEIKELTHKIRTIVKDGGDSGNIALAFVGLEFQEEE